MKIFGKPTHDSVRAEKVSSGLGTTGKNPLFCCQKKLRKSPLSRRWMNSSRPLVPSTNAIIGLIGQPFLKPKLMISFNITTFLHLILPT